MIRLHTNLCCSPSFRLQCADDASADASDLSALNALVVQTDNNHSTSVTSAGAVLNHRCDVERRGADRGRNCVIINVRYGFNC